MWSITPAFPEKLQPFHESPQIQYIALFLVLLTCTNFKNSTSNVPVDEVSQHKRTTMLFEHIVTKTNKVAIGPLEYCGNGGVIRSTHKKKLYVFLTTFGKYTNNFIN